MFFSVAGDSLPPWAMPINTLGIGLELGKSTSQSAGHKAKSQDLPAAQLVLIICDHVEAWRANCSYKVCVVIKVSSIGPSFCKVQAVIDLTG